MGQSAEDWLEQGRQFFQAGNYDRALESLLGNAIAQSLAISDRLAEAWYRLASAIRNAQPQSSTMGASYQPFQSPYYWAAFTLTGRVTL
jgi:CHAT domain-containing protein